jgi:hypothetical protein
LFTLLLFTGIGAIWLGSESTGHWNSAHAKLHPAHPARQPRVFAAAYLQQLALCL